MKNSKDHMAEASEVLSNFTNSPYWQFETDKGDKKPANDRR